MALSDRDKNQQQRLIGYANAGDHIILNGELLEILAPLNVYVLSAVFYKQITKQYLQDNPHSDPHEDPHQQIVRETSFVSWLMGQGDVRYTTASEAGLVSHFDRYTTFPFYPSYKDVMWVVRVLRQHLHALTPQDVYLLSVYRHTEIENRDVSKTLISRDIAHIQSLVKKLAAAHENHVMVFTHHREESHV